MMKFLYRLYQMAVLIFWSSVAVTMQSFLLEKPIEFLGGLSSLLAGSKIGIATIYMMTTVIVISVVVVSFWTSLKIVLWISKLPTTEEFEEFLGKGKW